MAIFLLTWTNAGGGWSHNLNHNYKVKSPTLTWTAESAKPKAHVCTQTFVCPGSGPAQIQKSGAAHEPGQTKGPPCGVRLRSHDRNNSNKSINQKIKKSKNSSIALLELQELARHHHRNAHPIVSVQHAVGNVPSPALWGAPQVLATFRPTRKLDQVGTPR